MPDAFVTIDRLSEERAASVAVYIHPVVANRLRKLAKAQVFIPIMRQPRISQLVKRGRVSVYKYIKSADGLSDKVHFAYGQKPINPPSALMCSQNTTLVIRENIMALYAKDYGCETDGSCGRSCINDCGHLCCVVYADDYYDTGREIKREYLSIADYAATVFTKLPYRPPRFMPRELGRTLLAPISYRVKPILAVNEAEACEAGYGSLQEFLFLWEEAYGSNQSLRLPQRPWVQAVYVSIVNDESHGFDICGYKTMIERNKH